MSDPFNRDQNSTGPVRSRWVPLWIMAVIVIAIGVAVFWGPHRPEKESSSIVAVQSKNAPSTAPQDDIKQAIAALQQTVKLLSDQVGALAARVDSLEKARTETTGATKKRGSPR